MLDNMIAAVITRRWQLAQGYHAVEIEPKHQSELPSFDDGAVIDVARENGRRAVRSHPLWHLPSRSNAFVLGVRQENDEAREVQENQFSWDKGEELYIGSPRNTKVTMDCSARYILFSAGLGVTAIAGIAKNLAAAGKRFEVHNFARTSERALFREELDALNLRGRISHHFGLGEDAIAQTASHAMSPTHANSQIIFSGPPAFMRLLERQARDWVYSSNIQKIILGEKQLRR
ncbi:oxidoreductase [Burkholderia vietnamiensis]|uniref:oxidoreductase n=1 Tax=Burkholderia vietnamiensis TaxID=60552 RepID=UPI002655590C|nr:oxidoreductase [Burkholderia vietnamiensis]MDN7408002.1 oxidoreductase [Burkholderia vietnamiensis]